MTNKPQDIIFTGIDDEFRATLNTLERIHFTKRLFAKDPTLWKGEKCTENSIRDRLGWIDSIEEFLNEVDKLKQFTEKIKENNFQDVLVLGMGGSSMCPLVTWEIFGPQNSYPVLHVLNYTDPDVIKIKEEKIDLKRTLFIVASKSGKTLETISLYKYFYERMKALFPDEFNDHFVAITDKGTSLDALAKDRGFWQIFENPGDFGGRYSALSYFGLVPMAVMGINVKDVLVVAKKMKERCGPDQPNAENPGLKLGAFLASNHRKGRDKLTFILPHSIHSFGLWVEQLLAESTGKEGIGIIPIAGELLGGLERYNNDRMFVYIYIAEEWDQDVDEKLRRLEEAGHPVVRICLNTKIDLGAEFFRWEMATAVAGSLMGINTFDEPAVLESKLNSKKLLKEYEHSRKLPECDPLIQEEDMMIYCEQSEHHFSAGVPGSIKDALNTFLELRGSSDFLAILACFGLTPERHKTLRDIRMRLRNSLKVATSLDYGPAYLHSTGQLYKGGPANGLFLMLTGDPKCDLPIPDEGYSFAVLQKAKALGDFQALTAEGRKAVRLHLGQNIEANLEKVKSWL
ncbi:MAG: transaldolase [Candidatus Auribacterota bacterium]|nr:transaldolase [Candidatus Auribacterota bacterium]